MPHQSGLQTGPHFVCRSYQRDRCSPIGLMEKPVPDIPSTLKLETCEPNQLLRQRAQNQDDSSPPRNEVSAFAELTLRLQEYSSANVALAERLEAYKNENRKLRSENEELVSRLQRLSAGPGEPTSFSSERGKQLIELSQPSSSGECFAEGDIIRKTGSLDLGIATWVLTALEDAPLYMSYCDSQLRQVWANRSLECVSKEEVVGKRLDNILTIECEAPEFIEFKKRALQSGQIQAGEITTRHPQSGRKTLIVTSRPHFNEEGAVIGLLTTSTDITEQVELKECLLKLRSEMATHKAAEDELRRAVQVTEEAIQAKNVFLAIMSHEIRTPLNGLLGLAEALDSLDLNGEQRELVSAILSSGVIIADILGDILDLASMEFGVLELEERPFDPSEIVQDIMKMALAAARGKDVVVSSELVNEIPSKLIGDAVRVRQILKYLVLNAIKFTERGNVCIKISIRDPIPAPQSVSERAPSQSSAENPMPLRTRSYNSSDIVVVNDSTNIDHSITYTRQRERLTGQRHRGTFSDCKLPIDEAPEFVEPARVMLYCEVEDTGVGIPKEAFATLFDKFKQVSEGPTRSYGGTGLGLAICKRLVEFMGGQLTVSSEVGEGSTFAFTVLCKTSEKRKPDSRCIYTGACDNPLYVAEVEQISPRNEEQVQDTSVDGITSSTTPPKPVRPKILLAEDNKVNVMVAISMLKRLGFTAKVVANGVEALAAIRKEKYDLVLLDVCMPLMDGLQVAYWIRKFEQTGEWPEGMELGDIFPRSVEEEAGKETAAEGPSRGGERLQRTNSGGQRIPIVAVTANALRSDVDKCFAHGMDAFIAKPVMFQKLQEILYKYLPTDANKPPSGDGRLSPPLPPPHPPSPSG